MKNHPSITQLVDVFEDNEYVHIVTDLCTGGELYDSIVQHATANSLNCNTISRGTCCFPEVKAARLIYQLLDAVAYMHSQNIVHRDLKPENILLQTTDVDSPIKIIDFGMAREHNMDDPPMTRCLGTPYYIAPEVLRKNYDRSCDLWSVGIITYILLCGYPPFNGDDNKTIHAAILKEKYRFPVREWKGTSKEARDFIRRLLQVDTRKRMTAEEALCHPWIVNTVVREIPLTYDQPKLFSQDEHPLAAVKASGIRPRAIVPTHFRVKTWF
jgi:serine/threonine protein kinase